ncbi:MAG: four-carbon acid sugar kinase family protein [Balneolales bacterium]
MIIVIADDFTGAAEIAGIAMNYGLKTEIQTSFNAKVKADLIVIDTNTRSKSAAEAKQYITRLMKMLNLNTYDLVFKKIDSVLRGHVYDEISVILDHSTNKSVLLAPSNPSRGRTISDGNYFIDGLPLHETLFSEDPEAPALHSDLYSIIKVGKNDGFRILKSTDEIPGNHGQVYLGEAASSEEIKSWAHKIGDGIIPAGAADFFEAILINRGYSLNGNNELDYKSLFICGSSLSRVVNLEEELFSENPKVVEVTEDQICMDGESAVSENIAQSVINHLQITNTVILFVKASKTPGKYSTQNIPKCLAAITAMVLEKTDLRDLFIEGGTTSSEIVRKIGWNRFKPVNQLSQGIIRMRIVNSPSHFLTVKPGSYKWPVNLWNERLSTHP